MKFENLVRAEDGKVVTVDLELTDAENQYFLAFAFNTLLTEGLIRLNEKSGQVELAHANVSVAPLDGVEKEQNENPAT